MTFLKTKKLLLLTTFAILISGCATTSGYDYTIHKPKVRYKPSLKALNKLDNQALGRDYVWAEEGPYTYDCSGLTYYNFGSMGIEIPRVADAQFREGTPIPRSQLQKGDLVFFGKRGRATHVGIYLGNDKFEHASSAKQKVIISSLNKAYYRRHYLGARRYHDFSNLPQFKPQIQQQQYIASSSNSKPETTLAVNTKQETIKPQVSTDAEQVNQPFAQQEQNIPTQTVNSSADNTYYILAGTSTNYPSELVTKLELSGMPVTTKQQDGKYKVLVGPFASSSEAKENISYNQSLLSNANIIKG